MPIARTEKLPSGRFRGVATVAGKRLYQTFDDEPGALSWAALTMRAAEERERSTGRARHAPTLREFVEVYLSTLDVERDTISSYRSWLKPALETFGDRLLRDDWVDPLEIRQWAAGMRRRSGREGCSPRTAQARVKAFRAVMARAVEAKHLSSNPTSEIKVPRLPRLPHRILRSQDEEDRLLEAAADTLMLDVVLVALDEGARWGEVFGLHVDRVDFANSKITICDVLERPDYTPRQYPKGKAFRTLGMTDRLAYSLGERVKDGKNLVRCPDGRRCPSGGWLMFGFAGKPARYDGPFSSRWRRTRKAAGLTEPKLRFHDLRHTFGTRLAESGAPLHVIAELLGHETTDQSERYIQAAGNVLRDAWHRHALDGGPSPLKALLREI